MSASKPCIRFAQPKSSEPYSDLLKRMPDDKAISCFFILQSSEAESPTLHRILNRPPYQCGVGSPRAAHGLVDYPCEGQGDSTLLHWTVLLPPLLLLMACPTLET